MQKLRLIADVLATYFLERAHEKTTVAGAVAVLVTVFHFTLPEGAAEDIVNGVVALAGVALMALREPSSPA